MKRIKAILASLAFLAFTTSPLHAAETKAADQGHKGQGTVNSVDVKAGKLNLTHGPIQSLKWPGMTMDFAVKDKQALAKLKPGQKVDFKVEEQAKGQFVITEITPAK